jgi:hypothetical protein
VLEDRGRVALRPDAAEVPTLKSDSPHGRSDTSAERSAAPEKAPQSPPRRRIIVLE